jgi:hypothetical protein
MLVLQRLRESLALILIALLPFHAFLVTVLTKAIQGPSHAPMGEIAVWKEGVLAIILLLALIEIVTSRESRVTSKRFKLDVLDILIIALFVLGVAVTAYSELETRNFIYGVRYDFVPLIAFLILRRVSWSKWFMDLLPHVLYFTGFAVVLYSLCSRFFPIEWFTWLGYSDLHSLYLPDGPLAAFQQIGDSATRRVQGPMSGPNQLGLWLLIPLSISLVRLRDVWGKEAQWRFLSYATFTGLAILYTFSRAAFIGAAVIVTMVFWPHIRAMDRKWTIGGVVFLLSLLASAALFAPNLVLRAASSRGHIENPLKAIQTMISHPLGLGLGTAGPASNRTSDTCVMLEQGSDPTWAVVHPDLCVFVGGFKFQPDDRACNCPFLPENWYLQIGVEMGWSGLGLYIALVILVLRRLLKLRIQYSEFSMKKGSIQFLILNSTFCIFAGVGVAALFLHAWEDSAIAYTVWVLIASSLQPFAAGKDSTRVA